MDELHNPTNSDCRENKVVDPEKKDVLWCKINKWEKHVFGNIELNSVKCLDLFLRWRMPHRATGLYAPRYANVSHSLCFAHAALLS